MTKPQDRKDSSSPSLTSYQENKSAFRLSPASEIKTEHGEKDEDTDLPADLPPDQKDLIYREIAFFRERAAAREREREREREQRDRDRDRDRQYGHYHQSVNFIPARESRRESYVVDDEEEEL